MISATAPLKFKIIKFLINNYFESITEVTALGNVLHLFTDGNSSCLRCAVAVLVITPMGAGNVNKSVIKALEVIELLDLEGPLGLTDISCRLNMEKVLYSGPSAL